MIPHLNKAKKFAKELSDGKKLLKSAWFGNRLATFDARPSIGDAMPLGELTFSHMQLPIATLDKNDLTDLKPVELLVPYAFLLALDRGQRIVAFKQFLTNVNITKYFTQMSCFDQLGRLIATDTVERHVRQEDVVECGPSEFVVYHDQSDSHQLSVYNSALKCLRNTQSKQFSSICCNSKFVFGLWYDDDDDDAKDDDDGDDQEEEYSRQMIRVLHLDTLSEAFVLRMPAQYTIERILADEYHVVAMCPVGDEARQWYMCLIDLATCNQIEDDTSNTSAGGVKTACVSLAENRIDVEISWLWLDQVFLLDGWLAVPSYQEIMWFDKEGTRSETRTNWDNTTQLWAINASRSGVLFKFRDGSLLMKRLCHDGDSSSEHLLS